MATKTVKKSTAKPAAKKTTVKKATVNKTAAKKAAVKKAAAPQVEQIYVAPAHDCGCGANCHCGHDCHCHCGCHGSKFWRFIRKLFVLLIVFALGFAAAKYCPCNGKRMPMPRAHFVNGCLDTTQIKCPKLLDAIPAMDINQDGCITKEEYKAVRKQLRQAKRPQHIEFTIE